ncbi:MAG: hypothetical protein K6F27_03100 [Ruminococcus sp.]|nr:hypothetical protein [Ruminococcus sp.]
MNIQSVKKIAAAVNLVILLPPYSPTSPQTSRYASQTISSTTENAREKTNLFSDIYK